MSELTALELATLFHVIYERTSAEFNYITRTDTRIFDPESSNGKLMIATCEEILSEDIQPKFDALTARNEELTSKLARMEALLDGAVQWVVEPDRENGHRCILCGATGNLIEEINHVAPCPVPYWLASKKEE